MNHNLHIVFPKEYMEILLRDLSQYEGMNVTGTDYDFDGFYHHALAKSEIECDTAIIVGDIKGNIPIEKKADDFASKMTEIRLERPDLRIIVSLPKAYEHLKELQTTLVSLRIYDIFFTDQFITENLIEWIENPKSLTDKKEFLVQHKSIEKAKESPLVSNENTEPPKREKIIEKPIKPSRMDRKSIKNPVQKVVKTEIIQEFVSIPQQNIAFISLSRGAGSTFHSTNFASFLNGFNGNVALYENPTHYYGRTYLANVFDVFGVEPQPSSIPHMIYDGQPLFLENNFKYNGITVYPVDQDKKEITDFKEEMYLRYFNCGRHTYKIVDFGYVQLDDSLKQFLQSFEQVIVCTDLSPSSFIPNSERYQTLKEWAEQEPGFSFEFWLNSFVSTYPKQELKDLELHKARRIPMFSREDTMNAHFNLKTAYDAEESIQATLKKVYTEYSNEVNIPLPTSPKKKKHALLGKISIF